SYGACGPYTISRFVNPFEKVTRVKPYLEEVYTKCHTKNDKSWIDERSEKVI
ncbi:hypothetical protein S245_060814, partial [Arachis hypogaea]